MKKGYWVVSLGILVLVLSLVSACGAPKASTPAATTPTATGTHTATGTPTATTTPTGTTTPTTATSTTTTTTTKPPTTTAGGGSLADILGKGAAISSIKYDMTITAPGVPTTTATVYMKNYTKIREDLSVSGVNTIILMDMDAGVMYNYLPDQNIAYKMTLDQGTTSQNAVEDPNTILQYNPQVIGTETIDGKLCTIISYDIPGTGTMKEWIWTEKGFPLKIETTTSQGTTTIEISNIDFSNIPDSTFSLPDGVQIIEM
jgi:outer membrane lipoprotein-sorting protein